MKKDIYKKIAKEVINTEIVSLNKLKSSLDINFKKVFVSDLFYIIEKSHKFYVLTVEYKTHIFP